MRRSRVLEKMRRGEPAISIKLYLADPRGVEIAAMCGYDFVNVGSDVIALANEYKSYLKKCKENLNLK